MNWLLLSALLLLLAGALVMYLGVREHLQARQMMARLGDRQGTSALQQLGERRWATHLGKSDPETLTLLTQLGWCTSQHRALFFAIQIALPLALTLLVLVWQARLQEPPG